MSSGGGACPEISFQNGSVAYSDSNREHSVATLKCNEQYLWTASPLVCTHGFWTYNDDMRLVGPPSCTAFKPSSRSKQGTIQFYTICSNLHECEGKQITD